MRLDRASHARLFASIGISALAAAGAALTLSAPAKGNATDAQAAPAVQAVVPAPAPASLWSAADLVALRAEIAAAAAEGLDPIAYGAAALDGLQPGTEADRVAMRIAADLAEDYSHGRIEDPSRFDWHIDRAGPDRASLERELRTALAEGRVRPWLRSLLPTDPRYAALRDAYAAAPDEQSAKRLRANLERWRWMPRTLGADHIYVNVPSYRLSLVDNGREVSSYTVVVGKPSTPTPQIAVEARSLVVNPWWNVPASIARTMKPGKGYVVSGKSIRQPPGPRNALGKVKIDMPNPYAIYLHDTPSKALFAKESRAFSHGCIRVKDIDMLARELAELDRGQTAEVERALKGSATRTVPLGEARPVYLVYFTSDVGADGRVVNLEDPYGRDARLIASLDRATQLAADRVRDDLVKDA